MVSTGIGGNPTNVALIDTTSTYPNEVTLAATPEALLDRLNLLLFYGQMPPALRTKILTIVNQVSLSSTDPKKLATAKLNRVMIAVLLSMASGDYLVQR